MTFLRGDNFSKSILKRVYALRRSSLPPVPRSAFHPQKPLFSLIEKEKRGRTPERRNRCIIPRGVRLSAAARRRGDKARSHATRRLWACGMFPLLIPSVVLFFLPSQRTLAAAHKEVDVSAKYASRREVVDRCPNHSPKNRHGSLLSDSCADSLRNK